MKKVLCGYFSMCCRVSCTSLFLLLLNIVSYAQPTIQGTIIPINDVTRQYLLSEEYGPDCRVFSLNTEMLKNTITNQGVFANFVLEIGNLSWEINASPENSLDEYRGNVIGGDDFWMYLKPPYLKANVHVPNEILSIRPLKIDIDIASESPLYVLCRSEHPAEPAANCGLGDNPIMIEVGVIIDKVIYDHYGGDTDAIFGDLTATFELTREFYADHGVIIDWIIREPYYSPGQVSGGNIGINSIWRTKRGCIPIDLLVALVDSDPNPDGMTWTNSWCNGEDENYPLALVSIPGNNLDLPATSKTLRDFAHELGHALTSSPHINDEGYNCTAGSFESDIYKCELGNCSPPYCFPPLMCIEAGSRIT